MFVVVCATLRFGGLQFSSIAKAAVFDGGFFVVTVDEAVWQVEAFGAARRADPPMHREEVCCEHTDCGDR